MGRISFSLLVVAALAVAGCQTSSKPAASTAQIVIGVAGPMTGDLSQFGTQLKRGAEKAVADINAAGGVLGKQVRLEEVDDKCDPKQASDAAHDLVSRGVVFVDGHFCSGSSIPASSIYHEAGVLQISPASSNPRLTDQAVGWGTVFRVCGRDDSQGTFAGEWLAGHYAGKRVAIVDDGSPYGAGIAQMVKTTMNAGGLREVLHEGITAGQQDFSVLVGKLKAAKVDVVYFGGYHPEAALIVRAMRAAGIRAPLLGDDALETQEFATLAGDAGNGVMFTSLGDARKQPEAAQIVDEFRKAGFEPEGYTLYSYAAVEVWAEAVTHAGTTDAAKVAQALRSAYWSTVVGPLSFDAKGDVAQQLYVWYVFQQGRYDFARM